MTWLPRRLPRHSDLWLIALGSLAAAVVVFAEAPWPIRLPAGLVAALLLPGYALSLAAFRRGELDAVERAALAFSLSLALIIALAPLVDRLPGGVNPTALVVSLSATTLAAAGLAWLRRRHAGDADARSMPIARERWRGAGLWSFFGLAAVIAVSGIALWAALSTPSPRPTEFYVVGADGSAAGIPAVVDVGAPVDLIVGIGNEEPAEDAFRVVIQASETVLAERGPVTVARGATWEESMTFTLRAPADELEIEVLLFRTADLVPYRTLRITLDAVSPLLPGVSPRPTIEPSASPFG